MAKGSGFNAKDTGVIPSGPKASDLGVPRVPAKTTMGTGGDAPRTDVARNPKGG